ncbi:hypothetical protein HXX76_005472 [Chlamydomonas incerta]|uniref:Uncharacterized protein n=1 Tax=Chlamydomonas incerta TaxID=51695 RepID=A0A835TCI1_CHLIN|nr:hypothetical protein HXX76_005472 [Chlamydomonas incerta]|eukprot:KAG2437854.1 hypothetical protein HXX76_005472 [Chlamydomonas incerta]
MPFLGIGAAFGGVARAAGRLRNRGNNHAKQDDLFFAEDEATVSALEHNPCGLPQCQLGRDRELATHPSEPAQPAGARRPEQEFGTVQPPSQPDVCSLKEEFVQAVASSSCDGPAGTSDFCSVGSFEARRRAVSMRKVREWDLACALEPSTPEPEPELLPGSCDSSSGGAAPGTNAIAAVVAAGDAAAQLAQPTQLALSAAAGDVTGSSGSSGGDTAASGASFGQLPSSASSASPSSSIALPDAVTAVTAAAANSAAVCQGAEASESEVRAATAAKSSISKPAPAPTAATVAAAAPAACAASPAPAAGGPGAASGRAAGGAAGCSRLAAVGFGDVLCGSGPQAAVAAALGGRPPAHVGYSAPHVVRAAVASSSRAVVATAAAMARPHPAALPAVPPPIILRDVNDVPLPAAQQLAARAASMASRGGSSARHSLDVAAAGAVTAAIDAAAAAAAADVAEDDVAQVVDSPLPPSILETRPPDLSSLMAIRQQVEVLRLMHLQRQAAALLAMPAASRGGAVSNVTAPSAAAPRGGGGGAGGARGRPLDLASAAAAAVAEVRAALAAAEAATAAGAGAAADGRSSSGSAPFTASSQQTSSSQVAYSNSPRTSPIKSTLSVTALAGGSPLPSAPASPLRPAPNGHSRHLSIDASPAPQSPLQLLQQADPGKAATGAGYSLTSAQGAAGGASQRRSPLQPQSYGATVGGGSAAAAASAVGGMSALSLSAPISLAQSPARPAAARAASPPPQSPHSGGAAGMAPVMPPADIQRQQAQLQQQIEALQRQIALKQQAATSAAAVARSPSPPALYSQQMPQMPMMPMMPMLPQQAWPGDGISAAARMGMLQQGLLASSPMQQQQQQQQQLGNGQHPHQHAAAGHGFRAASFGTANGDADSAAGEGGEGELLSSHPSFRQHLHDPVPVAEAAKRTHDWLASTTGTPQGAVPPPPAASAAGHDAAISPSGSTHGSTKSALKRDPSLRLSPHPAAYSPSSSAAAQPWQQQQQQQPQQPSRSPSPPPALGRAPSTRHTRFASDERTSPNSRSPSPSPPSPLARSASQRRNSAGGGGAEDSSPTGTGGSTSQSGMARAPSFNRTPSLSRTPSLMRSPSRRGPVPAELLDASNGPVPLWRIASFNRQLSVSQPSMVRRQKSITSQNSGGDGAQSSHRSSSKQRESSKAKARREAAALQAKLANAPPPSPLALLGAKLLQEAGEKLQPAPRMPTGRAFFVPIRPDLRLDISEHEHTDSPGSGLSPADSRDLERATTQDMGSARSAATGSAAGGWGRAGGAY